MIKRIVSIVTLKAKLAPNYLQYYYMCRINTILWFYIGVIGDTIWFIVTKIAQSSHKNGKEIIYNKII